MLTADQEGAGVTDAARTLAALVALLPPVLVVDDDEVSRKLIAAYCRKMGLKNPVVTLEDGIMAVDHLREALREPNGSGIPALVLLDLHMPGRDGLGVLGWIREQPALDDCPVVLLTGSAEIHEVEAAKDLKVSSYLVKPIGFRALNEVLRRINRSWAVLREDAAG